MNRNKCKCIQEKVRMCCVFNTYKHNLFVYIAAIFFLILCTRYGPSLLNLSLYILLMEDTHIFAISYSLYCNKYSNCSNSFLSLKVGTTL